jgi:hypothetical protein
MQPGGEQVYSEGQELRDLINVYQPWVTKNY